MDECYNCLIDSSEGNLVMYDDHLYCEECLDLIKFPVDREHIKSEFVKFVNDIKIKNKNTLFALSGGKDSIVALKILVENYGIRPQVFTIDHGFKNKLIIENCMNIIQKYKLNWYIYRVEENVIKTIKSKSSNGELPCIYCSSLWKNKKFYEICRLFNVEYLFTGGDTPINRSAIFTKDDIPNTYIGLPLVSENYTESEIYECAFEMGWIDPKIEGLDTDCIAVGIALENYRNNTGKKYHIEEKRHLSQKIRYGLVTKEDAKKTLMSKKPVSREEVEFFENI